MRVSPEFMILVNQYYRFHYHIHCGFIISRDSFEARFICNKASGILPIFGINLRNNFKKFKA